MAGRNCFTADGAQIRRLACERRMTDADLRRAAGMSECGLRNALAGKKILQRTAVQIAKALDCRVVDVVQATPA